MYDSCINVYNISDQLVIILLKKDYFMPKILNVQDRATMRSNIIQAAVKEFSRLGFEQTRIEQIAERAGIGKGTVYLYLDSKRDLFSEMLQEIGNMQLAQLEKTLNDKTGLKEQLEAIFGIFTNLALEQPDNLQIFISALYGVNRIFNEEAAATRKRFLERIESVLGEALIQESTEKQSVTVEVEPYALMILNMCQSLPLMAVSLGFKDNYINQHKSQLVNIIVKGILHQETRE